MPKCAENGRFGRPIQTIVRHSRVLELSGQLRNKNVLNLELHQRSEAITTSMKDC